MRTNLYSVYHGCIWICDGSRAFCQKKAKQLNRAVGGKQSHKYFAAKLGRVRVCR